ncbi:MAG: UDP-N-acetylmuramoyl-tripeptide--D-alanyl-D-alanine ligase [Chloroflexota bacterium]
MPREHEIKQKFTPTQRATRLLATAEIISVVVSLVVSRVLSPLWGTSPQDSYIQSAAVNWFLSWISFGGALVVLLTPLSLPLANIINFPLEETFRQFYLARAKRYLKRSGATVIAITGSYGKTSTKHYLHHILDGRFRVLMTPKSYNTLLGISRVINDVLSKDVSYEYFIAETDAYFVGENARICKLVEPTIGIVMTVGPMHLERLGSMENIATAQYEVVQALPPDGAAFFNGDDPVVRDMAGRGYPQTTQFVTQKGVNGGRLEAINVQMTAEGLDFEVRDNQTGEQRSMHAPLYGDHNVTNILMAAAVAHYLGMSLTEIAMRVTTLQPAEHRLIRRVMPDGTILIDDTYSANPVGTQTALGVLALQQQSQNRVVVSSGMFELGAVSDQENHKLGERMAAVATDVILIGAAQTQAVKKGLDDCHFAPDRIHIVSSFNEAIAIYKGILRPGDALLMLTDLPDTYA